MQNFNFLETGYRSQAVGLGISIFGLLLLIVGTEVSSRNVLVFNINLGNSLSNIGSLVAIIGLTQWTYDSYVRRKFFEEVITIISGTRSIYDLGIINGNPRSHEVDVSDQIINSPELTIVFAHSKRFLDRYYDRLSERARKGLSTTIYVNHPESHAVRYYVACGRAENYVRASIEEFMKVASDIDGGSKTVKIKQIQVAPKYSLVKAAQTAFYIFATSSEGQTTVPIIAIRKNSPLWTFVEDDLSQIEKSHIMV